MITVARILRSQGQKGELRLRFFHITPADCDRLSSVFIGKWWDFKEYVVEYLVPKGKYFDLKVEGVETLSQADHLAGLDVFVPKKCLKEREKGEYFLFQLIDCSVIDGRGNPAGRVMDVISAGSSDLLVLERDGREILIPFHESICIDVDVPGKRILIDPPEGLLDLNEI